MTLKTLEESNAENRAKHETHSWVAQNVPNGIGCPKCGAELVDRQPGIRTNSNPPKTDVRCLVCGFFGSRIV